MKKILLLPITLTALAPTISMVGCNPTPPEPEQHTVTFSAGEHGSLQGETTITVEGDETTLGEITKPTVFADEAHGWFFDKWDYDDSYVIKDDVTVTVLYQDFTDYVIDMNNIQSIIGMEGVQYMQIEGTTKHIELISESEVDFCVEMSPTVFHSMQTIIDDSYMECYVFEQTNDAVYYKTLREAPEGVFTSPEVVQSTEFITPQIYGFSFVVYYSMLIDAGGSLSFNLNDLCYKGEIGDPASDYLSVEFYFLKNQLIKFKMLSIGDTINEQPKDIWEQTITYNEVTPDLPIPPN